MGRKAGVSQGALWGPEVPQNLCSMSPFYRARHPPDILERAQDARLCTGGRYTVEDYSKDDEAHSLLNLNLGPGRNCIDGGWDLGGLELTKTYWTHMSFAMLTSMRHAGRHGFGFGNGLRVLRGRGGW